MSETVPQSKIGFWDFLENHLNYKVRLILPILIIAAIVLIWNYVRDLQQKDADRAKTLATLQQKFDAIGTSAISGNSTTTQKDLNAKSTGVIDPAIAEQMRQQSAVLTSLTQAIGVIQGKLSTMGTIQTDFGGKQAGDTGALTGFPLEESRTDTSGKQLPALSNVRLFYDPKQKDPNKAFAGTAWQHYTETFNPVVGQWEAKKDGGYKTTLSLSRTVSKPDPTDPTKMVIIGTEQVPITGAETIYSPAGLKVDPFKIPRWTATIGFSRDTAGLTSSSINGYQPAALLDYRVTNKFGATVGVVNKSAVVGLSIRFGNNK
jgi:hypothetical protein